MDTGILLEAGTNEMELLVFRVGDMQLGINVAKVRELIPAVKPVRLPGSPQEIEGSFRRREELLTLINLATYLQVESIDPAAGDGLIVVVELNKLSCGVLIDAVDRIYRLSWDQIESPSGAMMEAGAPITSIARINNTIVLILDFEAIIEDLLGEGAHSDTVELDGQAAESLAKKKMLVADDSPTIRAALVNILKSVGVTRLTVCQNGEEAWRALEASKSDAERFDIVLSDIEMPGIDGLHLTQRIKQDPLLSATPVVLFSSLIRPETLNKGKQVGADAQISKFDAQELIEIVARLTGTL
ncbi:MAG: response regulator [Candidatus Hydrogenedens sp.]|nr:response regulator [Candidatus Hydrogenedens sp.]